MLERAEKQSITVEHKVAGMEVECSERERGEMLLTAEHLKITGTHFREYSPFSIRFKYSILDDYSKVPRKIPISLAQSC